MSDAEPLVTVATFDSLTQAELARSVLDAEGIRSFLIDAETVNMGWYISGAVGGIKLQVAKSDFLPAERALHNRAGKARGRGLDDYGLVSRTAITDEPHVVRQEASAANSLGSSAITDQPDVVREQVADEDDAIEEDNEAEAMVRSALRAALLGLILLPPLLHIYSLWLLGCAKELRLPLAERYRKMCRFTAVLDAVVVLAAVLFVVAYFVSVVWSR
jgi:hypothetical protein